MLQGFNERKRFAWIAVLFFCLAVSAGLVRQAAALQATALDSVVSVLPLWPGKPQGGGGVPAGKAPEGSGIVVDQGGLIATAYHVVEPATRIDVRLKDGRILPAKLIGADEASDIALIKVDADLPPFVYADDPALADRACIIANAYGLDLSVTCGVVSARNVATAGFNPVEDFYQTDAAANPGSSGGALVDGEGRLIGMVSAIFASSGDTNIGVNFAVSSALLRRIVADLKSKGTVDYVSAGWGLEVPPRAELAVRAGVKVASLVDGPSQRAGVQVGDLLVSVSGRLVRHPRDVVSALSLVRDGGEAEVRLVRKGAEETVVLNFTAGAEKKAANLESQTGTPDCPYTQAICETRQAVFPVESFDPLASSVRIGQNHLVTNRHVVADKESVTVFTPAGPLKGAVIPTAYEGDLALIEVDGLPEDAFIFDLSQEPDLGETLQSVGADIAQRQVRVFQPGNLLSEPDPKAALGRLHVTSFMQPGVSGGALVDADGTLAGIAVGGGQGRYEAIPVADVRLLFLLKSAPEAYSIQIALGEAVASCAAAMDKLASVPRNAANKEVTAAVEAECLSARNQGQYLEAGRLLGSAGAFDAAVKLHQAAVDQTPNSLNARLSLLVSLQLAGRFEAMLPHASFVLDRLKDDPQALRFAIQSGVWGGDMALAEKAYSMMQSADPRQAQAARRFIDNPPPTPSRR